MKPAATALWRIGYTPDERWAQLEDRLAFIEQYHGTMPDSADRLKLLMADLLAYERWIEDEQRFKEEEPSEALQAAHRTLAEPPGTPQTTPVRRSTAGAARQRDVVPDVGGLKASFRFQLLTRDGEALGPVELDRPDWPPGAVILRGGGVLEVLGGIDSDDPEVLSALVVEPLE
jgi:hypothetical protein